MGMQERDQQQAQQMTSFLLDADLRRQLEERAAESERSISGEIRTALREHLRPETKP
jgi:plasmid stability protein